MIQFQCGLWSESFGVYRRNIVEVGYFIIMMLIVIAIGEHLTHPSSLWIGETFAAAYLALPAHLTVLTNIAGIKHLSKPEMLKRTQPFIRRTIGLSILPAVPLIAALLMLTTQVPTKPAFPIAIFR